MRRLHIDMEEQTLRIIKDDEIPQPDGDVNWTYLGPEGTVGVCVGFSSADRDYLVSPWPPEPGDFIGNDDPVIFRTIAAKDGETVEGTHATVDDYLAAYGKGWCDENLNMEV